MKSESARRLWTFRFHGDDDNDRGNDYDDVNGDDDDGDDDDGDRDEMVMMERSGLASNCPLERKANTQAQTCHLHHSVDGTIAWQDV